MGHSEYAPNLFLVAHDSFTGRMEVSRELVLCGLVASELAHLVIERRLGMAEERVVPIAAAAGAPAPAAGYPADTGGLEIDDYVVASVKQQSTNHSVRVWAESLGEVLYGLHRRRSGGAGRRAPGASPHRHPAHRRPVPRGRPVAGQRAAAAPGLDDPGAGDVHPGGSWRSGKAPARSSGW